MRETLVHILSQMLANNIGQRLTPELATGIANTFDRAVLEVQAEAQKDGTVEPSNTTLDSLVVTKN